MYFLQSGPLVRILAPAKLNLFLEVLGRRNDGFHEIETLMTALNIFDTLYFTANTEGRIRLTCRWACGLEARRVSDVSQRRESALGNLPEEKDNLVLQAVERLRKEAGVRRGASIHVVKRIPSAAGLGGASSDAAAALVAANRAWELGWSHEQLVALAAELGSDIPFFFGCGMFGTGAAICRGRGERIESIAGLPRWDMVVVRPPEGLATAEVYRNCQVPQRPLTVDRLLKAVRGGRRDGVAATMVNRLQDAAASLSPWIDRLRREFRRFDLIAHQMSGSGTSYFGVCRHESHARRVAAQLRACRVGAVYSASTPGCRPRQPAVN